MNANVKRVAGLTTLVAAILGGGIAAAAPASAACDNGHFCAFDGRSYSTKILDTTTTANTTVDVADNRVASVENLTSARYCGVNTTVVGTNQIVSRIPAGTRIADLSPNNDSIDFFWVGTAGDCG